MHIPVLNPETGRFAALTPFTTFMLNVGDGHSLYVEQSGNPSGIPVVVLHGGPGSGTSPSARERFDPELYHIICFDQRGAGQSTPLGCLEHNTTQHLIADIETIRTYLKLDKWAVYGTSWGCTLALLYAQAHPQNVLGLVVGGVFLAESDSFDWLTHPIGLPQMLPDYFARVQAFALNKQGIELIQALTRAGREALVDMAVYEGMAAELSPDPILLRQYFSSELGFANASIQINYYANQCFVPINAILENIPTIAHLPCFILQGMQDLVCPPAGAHKLHAALPQSSLTLVPACGHRATLAMEQARCAATSALAKIIKK